MICLLLLVSPGTGAVPFSKATYEHNHNTAVNFIWVLISGFFVMRMRAQFTLLEAGLIWAENAANSMMMILIALCIGLRRYSETGFTLTMETASGIIQMRLIEC